jgi:hypothetical protein
VEETRYPPYIMLNPGASAADEDADHGRSSTIPDVGATDKANRPDDRGVPVESEIVEEYLQE